MWQSLKTHVVSPLREAFTRWQDDHCNMLAAAVSYYAALSIFPLLLVLTSALGLFLKSTTQGQDAQQRIVNAIENRTSGGLAERVSQTLEEVQNKAALGGPLGIAGLALTAMGIFAQFERAFNRVWNTPDREADGVWGSIRNVLIMRLRAFGMLTALGAVLVLVFLANVALSSTRAYTDEVLPYADSIYGVLQFIVSVALNSLVLGAIYKWLPKAPVRWSEALRGGLLAALIWEVGRIALASIVIGDRFSNAYGLIGAFIAILLWIY